jgi:hypothetical protein
MPSETNNVDNGFSPFDLTTLYIVNSKANAKRKMNSKDNENEVRKEKESFSWKNDIKYAPRIKEFAYVRINAFFVLNIIKKG